MKVLERKVAIMTGGASGIGFEIARCFCKEACSVMVCDISEERLSNAFSQVSGKCENMHFIKADVTVEDDILQAVNETVQRFGRIDVLINNAGIIQQGKLDQVCLSEMDRVMRINVYAPWRFMVAVLPEMRKQGGGSIINIASISSIKSFSDLGLYCTSKAALKMLSEVMALEIANENIRVNNILPGLVEDTELFRNDISEDDRATYYKERRSIHPMGRNAKPRDIASAALFFASDQSEYITGISLSVDGGRHLATNKPVGI